MVDTAFTYYLNSLGGYTELIISMTGCETLYSTGVNPQKNYSATFVTAPIKFWREIVSMLSQNVGIIFLAVISSNEIAEVLESLKLG